MIDNGIGELQDELDKWSASKRKRFCRGLAKHENLTLREVALAYAILHKCSIAKAVQAMKDGLASGEVTATGVLNGKRVPIPAAIFREGQA